MDFKEWHEGHVTQYHRSGKHYVEFRAIGEKRWLNMKKIVFYIVERPLYSSNTFGEFKDDEIFENSGLAPVEVQLFCAACAVAYLRSVLFVISLSSICSSVCSSVCLSQQFRFSVSCDQLGVIS